jgi:NADH:ubiquinone oxidoreductase subunit 6 (subunit J)
LLVFRLARQPTWLLGFACMIAGFAFQVAALRLGPLTLVQPILAIELLFVFGYLALRAGKVRGRTRWREWGAAILLGIFVFQERLATSPAAMAAEVAGLIVLALGVWTLSGSELITHTTQPRRPEAGEATNRELTRRSR